MLPAIPPLVLLTTRLWVKRNGRDFGLAGTCLFTGVLTLIAAAVLGTRIRHLRGESLFSEPWVWRWIVGIACAGLLLCLLAFTRRKTTMGLATCLLVLAGVDLSDRYVLPRLDQAFSERPVTPLLLFWQEEKVKSCVYQLRRSWTYGLNFYAHREIAECKPPMPFGVQAIVSEKGLRDLVRMEKEQPEKVRVVQFSKRGVEIGEDMHLVGIFPRSPADMPGSGKPQ